jgi:hypothetical protein
MAIALDVLLIVVVIAYSSALATLGAVVAPAVFRSGWLGAGGLMTQIFGRFNKVAVVLLLVAGAVELARLVTKLRQGRGSVDRAQWASLIGVALFVAVGAVQSFVLTPKIAALYLRGITARHALYGSEFAQAHQSSSLVGRLSVLLSLVVVAAVLAKRRDGRVRPEKNQQTNIDATIRTA